MGAGASNGAHAGAMAVWANGYSSPVACSLCLVRDKIEVLLSTAMGMRLRHSPTLAFLPINRDRTAPTWPPPPTSAANEDDSVSSIDEIDLLPDGYDHKCTICYPPSARLTSCSKPSWMWVATENIPHP